MKKGVFKNFGKYLDDNVELDKLQPGKMYKLIAIIYPTEEGGIVDNVSVKEIKKDQ